ncbi:MAG: YfhO family protein [bacterium]
MIFFDILNLKEMFNKKDIPFALILIGITLLFFAKALVADFAFGYGDIHRYFYPIRYFSASTIKDGIIPLWNPYLFAGIPNLAALQPAVFYPISILPYIFPFFFGIKLFIISHFILSAIFTYLLMKSFNVSKTGALVSAITYSFGGFLLSVVDMLTTLSAATWTPLIFLFYARALTYKHPIYLILTGLFLGIQFLAGEPTQLYGTLITLTVFTICTLWGQTLNIEFRSKFNIQGLTPLPLVGLISLGLTLFQILPFLEMVFLSTRTSGLKFTHATSLSLGPHELLNLILPYFTGNFIEKSHFWFGQSWLESIYSGILPLLFACISIIFLPRKRIILFFAGIILIFILLSFGKLFPIYQILYQYLPGFSMIRYPVKFFSFVVFGGSVLAGFGYDYLITKIKDSGSKILNLFSTFILIYAGSFLLFCLNQEKLILLLKRTYFPYSSDIQIDTWANSLLVNFTVVCSIASLTILLIFLLFKEKISIMVFNLGIVGIIIVDLFLFGVEINPLISQKIYTYKSGGLKFILQDKDCYRILLEPKTDSYFHIIRGTTLEDALIGVQKSLVPNYGLFYKIFDAQGYESLTLNDYNQLLKIIKEGGGGNLLDVLNIKYVISKFELKMRQLKRVYEDEAIKIYWNTTYLPRAFFVSKVRIIKDRQKILEVMKNPSFDSTNELIIEEEIPNSQFQILNKSKIKIVDYQPNKVILNGYCDVDCILFLSDTYYPNWKAFIDGKPTKVYRANYAFRAINFPAGSHKVEFVYLPLSFLVGIIGSVITVFILIRLIVTVQMGKKIEYRDYGNSKILF